MCGLVIDALSLMEKMLPKCLMFFSAHLDVVQLTHAESYVSPVDLARYPRADFKN